MFEQKRDPGDENPNPQQARDESLKQKWEIRDPVQRLVWDYYSFIHKHEGFKPLDQLQKEFQALTPEQQQEAQSKMNDLDTIYNNLELLHLLRAIRSSEQN